MATARRESGRREARVRGCQSVSLSSLRPAMPAGRGDGERCRRARGRAGRCAARPPSPSNHGALTDSRPPSTSRGSLSSSLPTACLTCLSHCLSLISFLWAARRRLSSNTKLACIQCSASNVSDPPAYSRDRRSPGGDV